MSLRSYRCLEVLVALLGARWVKSAQAEPKAGGPAPFRELRFTPPTLPLHMPPGGAIAESRRCRSLLRPWPALIERPMQFNDSGVARRS